MAMAHDDVDVPVEAAASLFGAADETDSDFFATSFDSEPLAQGQQLSSHEQPISQHDSSAATNLFGTERDETLASLLPHMSHDPPQSGVTQNNPVEQTGFQGQLQYDHGSSGYLNQRLQNDERRQWHEYDYQHGYTSTYDYASQQPADASASQAHYSPQLYEYTKPSSDHVPSVSQPATQPASQLDYSQRYTPQEHIQRVPNESMHANSYVAPENRSYVPNSYNPSYPPVSFQANVSSYNGQKSLPQSAPTKKDVNAYRPVTLNAYDPPVLTKTRSKARAGSSYAPGSYHYSGGSVQPSNMHLPSQPQRQDSSDIPSPEGEQVSESTPAPLSVEPEEWYQVQPAPSLDTDAQQTRRLSSGLQAPVVDTSGNFMAYQDDISHRATETPKEPIALNDSAEEVNPLREQEASLNGPKYSGLTPPPLDSTAYESTQQLHVYGLDDQPFRDDQSSTNSALHPILPPQSTAFAEFGTKSMQASVVSSINEHAGNQSTDDIYHPTRHSHENSNGSHVESTFSSSEPPLNVYVPSTEIESTHWDSAPHNAYDTTGSGNVGHSMSTMSYDPYAPPLVPQRIQSRHEEPSSTGEYYHGNVAESQSISDGTVSQGDSVELGNVLIAPTYAPYAPSPSLLGTNDPLGRAAARVPLISFGFGGKLVSCFHSASQTSGGYDVSLTARQSTDVQLRPLHEIIPTSAMESSASSYPGPLFSDPDTSSISLARTVGVGTANNVKAKKAMVSKWLEERANEISSGVAYISAGSQERFNSEGRLVLVRLLKAMIDNDGQLSGSPSVERTVRAALIPRLEPERLSSMDGLSSADIPAYSSNVSDFNEVPMAVYHLRASALDRIQDFLLRGERHKAYHYALDEKLWAHAMVIAGSIDNQAWKEVVKEFLHSELAVKQPLAPPSVSKANAVVPLTNGRESLRVAYSLFAGHGATAVQELIPSLAVPTPNDPLLIPQKALHATPLSPNFPKSTFTSSVPPEVLSKWNETAAMVAFNQASGDSAALTALGDYLAANQWFEAAHACYLLSPRTSSLGGAGIPSVRVVLVGSESPSTLPNFSKDLDVTLFSEIVEFALSLSPAKGQETFGGLPHLQAYKLIRAAHLAEMGHVEVANRYCEAIGSVIRASTKGSPFYTPTFVGELKNLSDRLTAAPQLDKTASWISSKLAKPSLDTIGSWLEGRFSKLIVGEGEGEGGQEPDQSEQSQTVKENYGPFSHYSTISSATTSASPSPSPTLYGLNGNGFKQVAPPVSFSDNQGVPIDRASSAMDHLRSQAQRASPVPRVASASATTTTFSQASSSSTLHAQGHRGVSDFGNDGQEATWWGSHSQDGGSGPTPTAATFYKVEGSEVEGNFVSLMDSHSPETDSTKASQSSQNQSQTEVQEEEEDLGFGNTTKRIPKSDDKDGSDTASTDKSPPAGKATPDQPVKQTSSWFGRWWNRSSDSTSSGPVKAKLGEETSFYYDKELKRWVNKKAEGANATAATPPPPPPSRPRTASPAPGTSSVNKAVNGPPAGPPTRPASVAARKPPRARSNLVPTTESPPPRSASPSTTGVEAGKPAQGLAPPSGISRPKSSASKRNVRSRYVDVLQQ